jgi:Flp pilus assembly protein TadD
MVVLVAALAIAAGAAAYVYAPQLLRRREDVTITLETVRPPAPEEAVVPAKPTTTAPTNATTTSTPTSTTTTTTSATATSTVTDTGSKETGIGTETGTGKKTDREEAGQGTGKKTEEAEAADGKVGVGTKVAVARGPKALVAQAERLRAKGDVARALDLYGRVSSEDPENVAALTGRGLCYLDLSRYAPAAASFEAALALAPDDADALLGLAEAYRSQGRDADAVRYYEKYLAKHPDGDEAAVAQNALQELRR